MALGIVGRARGGVVPRGSIMGGELTFRPWTRQPRESEHRSLWLKQALEKEPDLEIKPLSGAQRVDICIIGGGFTGLWTAIRLKENDPSVSVAILEADL